MKILAIILWTMAALGAGLGGSLSLPHEAAADPPKIEKKKKKKAVERLGEQVSRGVIQEGLETLDSAENRARLGRVLNSPEMRDAAHDLTVSLVTGVIDGVVTARSTVGPSNADIGKAIRKGVDHQLTPAMARMVARMVDSALTASLTDEHITGVEALGERATHAAVRGLAKGLEEDLGPALAVVIERDILPAVGRGLDTPEMQRVVANLTRSFATEFVGGAGDAIDDKTDENLAKGKESGLQLFGNKVAVGYSIAMFVSFALGTLVIVLTVILFRSARRIRKQSESATQREAALMHLIDSLETDHPELKADMRNLLEEQLDG